jgi:hypothetical protein
MSGPVEAEIGTFVTDDWAFLALYANKPIQICQKYDSVPTGNCRLFALAQTKDIFVAAGADGICAGRLSELRKFFLNCKPGDEGSDKSPADIPSKKVFPYPTKVQILEFTSDEERLIVCGEDGKLQVFAVESFNATQPPKPVATISAGNVIDVRSRPRSADEVCVLEASGVLTLHALSNPGGKTHITDNVKAISWSPLGKQIMTGLENGKFVCYTPLGDRKREIDPPPTLNDECYPVSVTWMRGNDFVVVFKQPDSEHIFYVYVVARDPTTGTCTWSKAEEPCPPFGDLSRQGWWYVRAIVNWCSEMPIVVALTSAPSSDIGLLSENHVIVPVEDSERASLPLMDDEIGPVGFEVDVFSTEMVPGVGDEPVGPQPILWVMNNAGSVSAWHIIWRKGLKEGRLSIDGLQNNHAEKVRAASGLASKTTESSVAESPPATPEPIRPSVLAASPGRSNSVYPSPGTAIFGTGGFGTFSKAIPGSGSRIGFGFGSSLSGPPSPSSSPFGKLEKPSSTNIFDSEASSATQPSQIEPITTKFGSVAAGNKNMFGQPTQPLFQQRREFDNDAFSLESTFANKTATPKQSLLPEQSTFNLGDLRLAAKGSGRETPLDISSGFSSVAPGEKPGTMSPAVFDSFSNDYLSTIETLSGQSLVSRSQLRDDDRMSSEDELEPELDEADDSDLEQETNVTFGGPNLESRQHMSTMSPIATEQVLSDAAESKPNESCISDQGRFMPVKPSEKLFNEEEVVTNVKPEENVDETGNYETLDENKVRDRSESEFEDEDEDEVEHNHEEWDENKASDELTPDDFSFEPEEEEYEEEEPELPEVEQQLVTPSKVPPILSDYIPFRVDVEFPEDVSCLTPV